MLLTDFFSEANGFVVGEVIAERLFRGVEEILTINEDERSLLGGFLRQSSPKKNNPARGPKADPAGRRYIQYSEYRVAVNWLSWITANHIDVRSVTKVSSVSD